MGRSDSGVRAGGDRVVGTGVESHGGGCDHYGDYKPEEVVEEQVTVEQEPRVKKTE